MHRKKSQGSQSPTWYFTPEMFNPGTGLDMSSWTCPCQRPFMQQIIWEPAWMMWWFPKVLSVQVHSPMIMLLFQWNFCLRLSFLLDYPCWYVCYYLYWHFLLFTYMPQTPHVDPGAWSTVLHTLTGVEYLLPVEYSRSLELYVEKSDMEQNYSSKGADRNRVHCNGWRP